MNSLILGTRGSDLALVQTRDVAARLRAAHPGLEVAEKIIRTTGDQRLDVSLSAPGPLDKGLFTKELEDALLAGTVAAAVHSLKDLPTEQPPGLMVGAILERADCADALVSKHEGGWQGLPDGATVATSSLRRKNQILHLRPDLRIVEIRGNVPTRLRKVLENPDLDALIVARAAIDRLGSGIVPGGLHLAVIEEMLPAPGQGAVGVECRSDDTETLALLAAIHHEPTARCVHAERELLQKLGGGCHMPLGARATIENDRVRLLAALFEPDGIRWLSQDLPAQ
ncbi:MAG: hydroxymethylbilane synthase [Verrucomicrobiae bacterium]